MLAAFRSAGYRFAAFPEAERLLPEGRPFVLLRHDIDIELPKAWRMAELEAEAGVRATYLFMVRTDLYNVFSAKGTALVRRILGCGHHLGLHFDCAAYAEDTSVEDFSRCCAREVGLLETWFERPVSVVSFHRPGPMVLSGNGALTRPLKHTYMREFTERIHYLADSRGLFRYGSPTDSEAFLERRPLHVLVHPIWWNDEPTEAYQTLLDFVGRQGAAMERALANNCVVFRTEEYPEDS